MEHQEVGPKPIIVGSRRSCTGGRLKPDAERAALALFRLLLGTLALLSDNILVGLGRGFLGASNSGFHAPLRLGLAVIFLWGCTHDGIL